MSNTSTGGERCRVDIVLGPVTREIAFFDQTFYVNIGGKNELVYSIAKYAQTYGNLYILFDSIAAEKYLTSNTTRKFNYADE